MTKKYNIYPADKEHPKKRAKERYGINYNKKFLKEIRYCLAIKKDIIDTKWLDVKRSYYHMVVKGKEIKIIFDRKKVLLLLFCR